MNNELINLLNEHEAAERLRLAVTTLRRWRWGSRGPRYVKIGGAVRYDPADLDAFVKAGRRDTSDSGREAA